MRRILYLSIVLLLMASAGHAQSPPGINYQGVARNSDGKPLALRDITIRINILKDGGNGDVEYSEIHSVKTNSFGLFTLVIGTGNATTGSFPFISWAVGNKWLRVEMDQDGGSSFQLMGSQQFMSVPYAFYAKYAGNSLTAGQGISISNNVVQNTGDADNNPANEFNNSISLGIDRKLRITDGGGTKEADLSSLVSSGSPPQDLQLTGDKLKVTDNPSASEIDLAPYRDDTDKQNLLLLGTTLSIDRGNSINLSSINTDAQNIALTGTNLSISGGNTVNLSTINTDAQNISLTGTNLSITGGNSVNLASINAPQNLALAGPNLSISSGNTVDLTSVNTDNQVLTFVSNNLSISGGNSVNLAALAADGQQLNLAGSTLSITGGNNVSLAPFLDNTDNQDLTLAGNTLSLTNDGTTVNLAPYLDNTDNQDLALTGNTLSLSNDATTVNLAPYLDNTDNQDLALAGNTLSLTNDGTTVNLAPYLDNTDNQDLALAGNTLSLTNDASPINLAPYLDNTDNQNLSVTSPNATTRVVGITGGTGVTFSVADDDSDPVNEFQTLSYNGTTKVLSIAPNGNSVTIAETQNMSQVLTQGNDAGGQKIANLATPTLNADAATKQYVDNADAAINARISANYAFKTNFTFSTLLTGASNVPLPLAGESFDDFNVVNAANFTAQAAGTYVFTVDGDISSLLVGSTVSVLYNGTKYPVSVGSNNRYNTTLMFRLTVGQTVSLVADGIGINTNINGSFFGYKLP